MAASEECYLIKIILLIHNFVCLLVMKNTAVCKLEPQLFVTLISHNFRIIVPAFLPIIL